MPFGAWIDTSDWKSSCESAQRMAVNHRKQPCVTTSDGCFPATALICIT